MLVHEHAEPAGEGGHIMRMERATPVQGVLDEVVHVLDPPVPLVRPAPDSPRRTTAARGNATPGRVAVDLETQLARPVPVKGGLGHRRAEVA